jgi:subtilisin family serine protease
MSYAEDDVYPLPGWNSTRSDEAVKRREDIAVIEDGDGWVFHRPQRIVLDAEAVNKDGVADLLRDADAEIAREPDCDAVLDELGLVLVRAPADRLVTLVTQLRDAVAGSASLDHVLIAGPAYWHGDDEPEPIDDPGDIPGSGDAGAGLTVVVLDTGIEDDPPFPVDSGGAGDREVADEDGDKQRDPPAGHGTHIAGLIARTAPGARIVAHRVLKTEAGQIGEIELAQALLGLPEGVDLVNCSFSGAVLGGAQPLVVERALARLSKSTVVVGCAGNNGKDRSQWPAASKRVIAVGAIGRDDASQPWRRTDFSNYGDWVDACAPGVRVPSAFLRYEQFDGWAHWSGTSFSAPQVVAAIAAVATADGSGDVVAAADKLVRDKARPRIDGVGAIVDPDDLP